MRIQTEPVIKETERHKYYIDKIHLLGPGLFKFFKNDKKVRKKYRLGNYSEFQKICRAIWKKVSDDLINNTGGVALAKFGYLAHWRTPSKRIFKSNYCPQLSKIYTNFHTDGYFYNTGLFTQVVDTHNGLKGWSLDKAAGYRVKRGMAKRLKSGMKYKFHYSLIKSIYSKNNKEINFITKGKRNIWL